MCRVLFGCGLELLHFFSILKVQLLGCRNKNQRFGRLCDCPYQLSGIVLSYSLIMEVRCNQESSKWRGCKTSAGFTHLIPRNYHIDCIVDLLSCSLSWHSSPSKVLLAANSSTWPHLAHSLLLEDLKDALLSGSLCAPSSPHTRFSFISP